MSYAPGAPGAIWAIPDDVLDDGAKVTVMRLWSWADHEDQRAVRKCKVYARDVEGLTYTEMLHEQLAAETGRKVRKIRRHLGKARALGLIATCGKHVWLFPPADGQALTADGRSDHERSDHERAQPDHERSGADHGRAQPDRKRSLQLDPPVPSSPPSPGEDAPELPGHVARELARAKREQAPATMSRASALLAGAHGFSTELLAQLGATSQAAHVALMSSDCTPHTQGGKSWAALLAKNILDRGLTDDQVIRVLEHWELARTHERPKPPMGKLWWWGKATSMFVDDALGDDATPSRPQAAPPSSSYADWDEDSLRRDHAQGAGR